MLNRNKCNYKYSFLPQQNARSGVITGPTAIAVHTRAMSANNDVRERVLAHVEAVAINGVRVRACLSRVALWDIVQSNLRVKYKLLMKRHFGAGAQPLIAWK